MIPSRSRPRSAARLADLLERVTRQRKWDGRLSQEAAVAIWPEIVGEELARHCVALGVRGGTLQVAVRSGTWATQLTFFRTDLVRRLKAREITGVRDIAFRVGLPAESPLRWPPPAAPGPPLVPGPSPDDVAVARRLQSEAGEDDLAQGLARLYLAAAGRRRRLQIPRSER